MISRALVHASVIAITIAAIACSSGGSSSSSSGGGAGGNTTSASSSSQGGTSASSSSGQGGLGKHACNKCDDSCIDLATDGKNCGHCGKACSESAPVCSHGTCIAPACNVVPPCPLDHTCCGDSCCPAYAVCCLDDSGSASCVSAPDGGAISCPTSCCK